MRCLSCHKLSWHTFCKKCQAKFLQTSITKRTLNTIEVYSFFKYNDIQELLLTKHTPIGFIVYRALAKQILRVFIKNFVKNDTRYIYIIGVDDSINGGYSHIALLTQQLSYKNSKVLHSKLMATNNIKYAGKTLQFRLENPRNFRYSGKKDIEAILVDDIITTGTTLKEAIKVLKNNRVNVLFALTLASV